MLKKITAAIIAITLILMGAVFLFANDIDIAVSELEAQAAIDEYLAVNEPESMGVRLYPRNISICLLYTSPSPRDATLSRMPSSA